MTCFSSSLCTWISSYLSIYITSFHSNYFSFIALLCREINYSPLHFFLKEVWRYDGLCLLSVHSKKWDNFASGKNVQICFGNSKSEISNIVKMRIRWTFDWKRFICTQFCYINASKGFCHTQLDKRHTFFYCVSFCNI